MKSRAQILEELKKVQIPEKGKKKKPGKIDEEKVAEIIFDKTPTPAPDPVPLAPKEAPKEKAAKAPAPAPQTPEQKKEAPVEAPPRRKPAVRRKQIRSFTLSDPVYEAFYAWCSGNGISMSEILERMLMKMNEDEEFRKMVVARIYQIG